jgi:hypothetical protein
MFDSEFILRWPRVSHTVQAVSEKLHRLWGRLVIPLALLAVVFFGLALYWSIRPALFDVREVALRQSGGDPEKLVPGAVTTATLIEVTTTLLEKRGGFLSNDINPVSLWLDNMPHWEFGALVQVRDFARVLRNDFARAQSQSKKHRDLAIADPRLHFKNDSWIFPTTEGQYRDGVDALKRYLARLEGSSESEARFFVRVDNLRSWLNLVAKRLGDLAHRLSASVGVDDLDAYAVWDLAADKTASQINERAYKTPWLAVDDTFYEARGATWALLHFMYAIQIDFEPSALVHRLLVTRQLREEDMSHTEPPTTAMHGLNPKP